ncbi:MAG: hypothetical protein DDG59_03510, partial [Anaerolineae bacterium]
SEEQTILVALNFFALPATLQLDVELPGHRWQTLLGNESCPGEISIQDQIDLSPHEIWIGQLIG